jgi:hypothetical protein
MRTMTARWDMLKGAAGGLSALIGRFRVADDGTELKLYIYTV